MQSPTDNTPEQGIKPRRKWRRRVFRTAAVTAAVTGCLLAAGCYRVSLETPCFDATYREARDLRHDLSGAQVAELQRPVLLLSGYRAAHSMVGRLHWRLAAMTTGDKEDFLAVSYFGEDNIDDAVERAVAAVEERWPSDDPDQTIEIDVVAISMGGLVARAAAEPPEDRDRTGKRLNIARLYTLASPHRGAVLANRVALDQAARSMKPGSQWLTDLNSRAHYENYELVCYGQTRDGWVGLTNTAPPGRDPFWTHGTLMFSHFSVPTNPWFLGDIALRLRGEDPISTEPATPPRN